MLVLKVLKARGVGWVGVSEPSDQRRAMAAAHDASVVFDPRSIDVVAETFKATNGVGADVVFDCAGIQATFEVALAAARPRGNIMNIAIWGKPANLDMNAMLFKEVTITGGIILRIDFFVTDALPRCHWL